MTVTKLIEQVRDDRKELDVLKSAIASLTHQQESHPALRYRVADHSISNIELPNGEYLMEQITDSLIAASNIYHDRIIRNNKILATADSLVRGLSLEPEE